jgi:hypothetical protein
MLTKPTTISLIAIAAASVLSGSSWAEPPAPNRAGSYRCEPAPRDCQLGKTFTVTESGGQIEFKNESGTVWHAKFTLSGVPTWNSNGIVLPNGGIEWSNGTRWRRQ